MDRVIHQLPRHPYEDVTPFLKGEAEGEFGKLKSIEMTDEYAAHYWYEMGWTACRLAMKLAKDAEEAGAWRI